MPHKISPDSFLPLDLDSEYVTRLHGIVTRNIRRFRASELNDDLRWARCVLGLQYELWDIYAGDTVHYVAYEKGLLAILLSAFHKNLFAFLAAIDLTEKGLYGPARTVLRYVFESLTLAKYCAVSLDGDLIQTWHDEKPIFLANDVLKKIQCPDASSPAAPLKYFLNGLHQFTHPTRTAQQISLAATDNWEDLKLNLVFVRILLECNYHVLNRHILKPCAVNRAKRYAGDQNEDILVLRVLLKQQLSLTRQDLTTGSKQVIRDFTRRWTIKPTNQTQSKVA